jgi:hypothetical protein
MPKIKRYRRCGKCGYLTDKSKPACEKCGEPLD